MKKGKWWVCMTCGHAVQMGKGWKPRTRPYGYKRWMDCEVCTHNTLHVVVDMVTAAVCNDLRAGFRVALRHIVGVAAERGKR